MSGPHRRIVTGVDESGRSCVLIDGPPQPMSGMGRLVWRTDSIPADNTGRGDAAAGISFGFDMMQSGGSGIMVVELPPGNDPFTHATATIDNVVMMNGRITLVLETGDVTLGPGELLVDRGVNHAWRNDGPEPAVFAVVFLPAQPLGEAGGWV